MHELRGRLLRGSTLEVAAARVQTEAHGRHAARDERRLLGAGDAHRDVGLTPRVLFDATVNVAAPMIATGSRPKVAILREQGVNSHIETGHVFTMAGFDAYDVHMTDLQTGRRTLDEFKGFVACGGFSYGDVLGAGAGWAKSILLNPALREQFQEFFGEDDTFALGICNGCQMLAQMAPIIPGAEHWPKFVRNGSEQFECRTALVEVMDTPSIFFKGMEKTRLPIVVAHGEGFAQFKDEEQFDAAQSLVTLRFIDGHGAATETDGPVDLLVHTSRSGSIEPASLLELKEFKRIVSTLHTPETVTVPGLRIDSFFRRGPAVVADYNFMVLDIQGAELMALRGARQTVQAMDAVQAEAGIIEMYEGGALYPDLQSYLAGLGLPLNKGVLHELYDENGRFPAWGEFYFANPTSSNP